MQKPYVVWGAGSLAQDFLTQYAEQVSAVVDSYGQGTVADFEVAHSDSLSAMAFDQLIICSSFVDAIFPLLTQMGIAEHKVSVYQPGRHELAKRTEYREIRPGEFVYLPWQACMDTINLSLSNDIVFSDVYKELAKSVGYIFTASVEGDMAEFGTCSGHTASLQAYALNYYSQSLQRHESQHGQAPRTLHLFDSFQGFPEASSDIDKTSPHVSSGAWGEGTAKGLSESQLTALCQQFLPAERIKTYPGWYKDTLSTIDPTTRFAMVHLDCDLYESTFDVLYHLMDQNLLSEGAMLLFDNWFCNRASPDFGEQKAWADIQQHFDVQATNLGHYACVGNKIIVHQYTKRD